MQAARRSCFPRLAKEIITVAAKMGDPDPEKNPRACGWPSKEAKVTCLLPKEVIDRAIKKSQARRWLITYDEIRYEGYGPRRCGRYRGSDD